MGQPKALLTWEQTTLLEYQVKSLIDGGVNEVVVVLGHNPKPLICRLTHAYVRHVINQNYHLGKTTSIKLGISAANPKAGGFMLLGVDQPRTSAIIRSVLDAHQNSDKLITSPRFRGRGGHPLIFAAPLKQQLESLSEESQGIRAIFKSRMKDVTHHIIDDPMIRLDINTPEAYEDAKQKYLM